MRYFYDCEFLEVGPNYPIYLVSIGVKCEDGRLFYAENEDAPLHLADDWFKKNVTPHLHLSRAKSRFMIVAELMKFVSDGEGDPVFWGYYSSYDHVVLAQLFGKMIDMPSSWPKYTMDLKQTWTMLGGNIPLPDKPDVIHHGLNDAEWNEEVWRELNQHWKKLTGKDLP